MPKIEGEIVFDQDTFLGKWRSNELFYIIGCGKGKVDKPLILFGFSHSSSYLGTLLGSFLDMRDKFKENLTKTEEVK